MSDFNAFLSNAHEVILQVGLLVLLVIGLYKIIKREIEKP
jgi:hypothetical protein